MVLLVQKARVNTLRSNTEKETEFAQVRMLFCIGNHMISSAIWNK